MLDSARHSMSCLGLERLDILMNYRFKAPGSQLATMV